MEMQQKPYEWMVKYTPQKEWIEEKGVLVWITEVLTSVGAGLFLVSLFLNNLVGMIAGYLIIVVLDIPLHLLDYGKPFRFWRTIVPFNTAWKTSWFSRGVTLTVIFSGVAFIQMCLTYWLPGTAIEIIFKVLAGISVFMVGIYSGFIMNYCRSIPFWNSALLPVLSIANSICDGFFLLMAIGLAGAQLSMATVTTAGLVLLIACTVLMFIYLWSQTYTSVTARESVLELIRGYIAPVFWIGVVILGMIIPLGILGYAYLAGASSTPLLVIAIVCRLLGTIALKYCLLKAGVYSPLIPTSTTTQ